MSRTHIRTQILMTVVLILTLSVCASPRELVPPREQIIEYGTPTNTLNCQPTAGRPRPDTQRVGNGAARLRSGNVVFDIPAGAVLGEHRVILQRDSGQAVRAFVETERPLHFQNGRSAQLTFDVSGCELGDREWWVWRLNPDSSQKLSTRFTPSQAIAPIDSTSWFIIAN
jgi:hypothetical protein